MALMQVNFFAQTLGMAMTLEVILPEGSQGIGVDAKPLWDGEEKLPVLYLLHGASDDHTIWQRRTSVERYAADKKLAIVMPAGHLSCYTNQKMGFRFFDYIAYEVPEFCQRYFKISARREENFIAGLSMGGYGALKIGIRCGDRFGFAAGLSSGCDRLWMLDPRARQAASLTQLEALESVLSPAEYQRARQFFITFGSPAAYEASNEDNLFNAVRDRVAKGLPMPQIFMACGTEDFALDPNRRFHSTLCELGVDHRYIEAPGVHDWAFWDTHIQEVLGWLPV